MLPFAAPAGVGPGPHRPVGLALGALLLGALALVACNKDTAAPAPTQTTEALKPAPAPPAAAPLKVAYNQWVGFAGLYLAEERGLFAQHHVRVVLLPFSGPGDSIPPLLAGQLDLSLTTANNLALIAGKQPTAAKIIYLIDASDGADAVVASLHIKSVADLKGKTVAVTKGEINQMLLTLALESAQLDESALTLVDMSPDDAGAAFMAGKVDAAVTWEPWVSRAKEKQGHVIYSSKDAGAKDTLIDVMAASDEALAERAEDLKHFVQAFDAGVELLTREPEAAKAILAKRLEAKPEDIDGMLAGARLYRLSENQKLLSDVLPNTLNKIDGFLRAHALVDHPSQGSSLISRAIAGP